MDNVLVVVEDLKAAIGFFEDIGMQLEGETTVEGPWIDRIVSFDGSKCDIAMMRTADGNGRVELEKYHAPPAIRTEPQGGAPVNALGLRRIMFAVEDLDAVLARLESRGAQLIGEVVQFEDTYRLCYVRGPEGIMIALAEQLS